LTIIEFTRPDRLNSFIEAQYQELSQTLYALNKREDVSVVLLTGKGKFYSSGHDLATQANEMTKVMTEGADLESFCREMIKRNAHALIAAFIDFEKPLIIGCNGPAVGVAATTLCLADIVYCTESSTFNTPFMQFAFCAEGCSSLLFPAIMGFSKANELLLLGKKIDAREAKDSGLVADVFPDNVFHQEVLDRARTMARFPPNALRDTKGLTRAIYKDQLHETNNRELELLVHRFMSDECFNAVSTFMMQQKRSKRPAKL
jgi:peroxisomal 3,2-trans-enoyl-CoA isomerase